MDSLKLLDCTFRDGGYYVEWDFDEATVRKYLAAISTAKIDIIEIGFRFLSQSRFLGPFAYSSDYFLNTLPLPANVAIAVMINAKELIDYDGGVNKAIDLLFANKKQSPVDIVRIASETQDLELCYPMAKVLSELGYRVFINIMKADKLNDIDLIGIAEIIKGWKIIEVIYFADSFGNMNPILIQKMIAVIRSEWDGAIGIHAHDNKGQALLNTTAAFDSGVTYLDGTILGMGRGAGNVKMETLLVEINHKANTIYFPDALFPLALQEFTVLQEKYNWGPNIYYFLSAIYGIHPTYIQELISGELYDTEQILAAINFLKSTSAPFYSFEKMLRSISGVAGNEYGQWDATGWAKGRDVLIIAPGPGTKRHIGAIQHYVEKMNPIVLCLNVINSVPKEMVTAYVACHETRILIESDVYTKLDKPLILPLSRVPETIKQTLNGADLLDFGMRVEKDQMNILNNGCVLGNSLSLIYAIAVATAGGANKVYLSGVDGYEVTDPRHQEIVILLEKYSRLHSALRIQAITATTYPIEQCSVYDPELFIGSSD